MGLSSESCAQTSMDVWSKIEHIIIYTSIDTRKLIELMLQGWPSQPQIFTILVKMILMKF